MNESEEQNEKSGDTPEEKEFRFETERPIINAITDRLSHTNSSKFTPSTSVQFIGVRLKPDDKPQEDLSTLVLKFNGLSPMILAIFERVIAYPSKGNLVITFRGRRITEVNMTVDEIRDIRYLT